MVFDKNNESDSPQLALEEMRKNLDINWFLWKLKAQTDEDVRDFTQFADLCSKSAAGSVSLSTLSEWGISLAHSRILRNLLREKMAETSEKEIRLTFPLITEENAAEYLTRIADFYHKMIQSDRPDLYPFPSTYFYLIDQDICKTVAIRDLGWQTFDNDSFKNKLIEIAFIRFHIPPVLTSAESIGELVMAAKEKIIRRLSEAAAENGDFFSRYIKFEGFSIKKRFPTLSENDLIPIKTKKGQDYQYGYTQIFLDKVFSKQETATEYINAINFEQYSDLGVLFSPSKRENYDFIQSYLIYKELTLPQIQNKKNAIKKLEEMLLSSLRLYMTETEIKEQIFLMMPDVSKEYQEKIFSDFQDTAILQEKLQKNFTILFFPVDFFGSQETIYMHASNLNRYLNKMLNDISEPMEKQFRDDWKAKLMKYHFEPEMFSSVDFNEAVFEIIRRKDSILCQILRQKKCRFYLTKLKGVTLFASKLIMHGNEAIAEVLKLDPEKIYAQLVAEIKKEKSLFGRMIFSFFNWYYLRAYKNRLISNIAEAESSPRKEKDNAETILSAVEAKSSSDIDSKCDSIWKELGADQVPRRSLENNIKNDLLEYFKNRDQVNDSGLQVIIERNSNRIIRQAPHLSVYQEKLNEFIRLYAYKMIATTSSLRGKWIVSN